MPFGLNAAAAAVQIIMDAGGFAPGQVGFADNAAAGSIFVNDFRGEHCEFLATAPLGNFKYFALEGINIPNLDSTFNRLEIRGTYQGGVANRTIVTLRSAMVYNASVSGNTQWEIDPGTTDDNFVVSNRYYIKYI